jgi:hypothetical protein
MNTPNQITQEFAKEVLKNGQHLANVDSPFVHPTYKRNCEAALFIYKQKLYVLTMFNMPEIESFAIMKGHPLMHIEIPVEAAEDIYGDQFDFVKLDLSKPFQKININISPN